MRPEITACDRVDAVGRFVKEKDLRGMNQGAGEAKLLLHAADSLSARRSAKGAKLLNFKQFINTLFFLLVRTP